MYRFLSSQQKNQGLFFFTLLSTLFFVLPHTSVAVMINSQITDWSKTATTTFEGSTSGDDVGSALHFVGDVNADGFDDMVISAPGDDTAASDAGAVYLLFGSAGAPSYEKTMTAYELASLPGETIKITGESASDNLSSDIARLGDCNNDGIDDFAISSKNANGAAGRVYIFFGNSDEIFDNGSTSDVGTILSASTADVLIDGAAASDNFGEQMSGGGDVNGDGVNDFIVGARTSDMSTTDAGAAYVVFGRKQIIADFNADGTPDAGAPFPIDTIDIGATIVGNVGLGYAGDDVALVGDVNGDGFDDVALSSHRYDVIKDEGIVYGVVGGASKTTSFGALQFSDINGDGKDDMLTPVNVATDAAYTITGVAQEEYFGQTIVSAGDVNSDGLDDLLVGAPDASKATAGSAHLFLGSAAGITATTSSDADYTLTGDVAGDYFGHQIASAGDVDMDGKDDLLIGARFHKGAESKSGSAYLFFGKNVISDISVSTDGYDMVFDGENADDYFSYALAGGGDVNGDGYSEILIGAKDWDSSADTGAVYLVRPLHAFVPIIVKKQLFFVSENAANGTVLGKVTVLDADAIAVMENISITSGNESGVFGIDPSSGVLTIANTTALDYETTTTYALTISASDGVHTVLPTIIDIIVLDIAENVETTEVAENSSSMIVESFDHGTLQSIVKEKNTLVYTFADNFHIVIQPFTKGSFRFTTSVDGQRAIVTNGKYVKVFNSTGSEVQKKKIGKKRISKKKFYRLKVKNVYSSYDTVAFVGAQKKKKGKIVVMRLNKKDELKKMVKKNVAIKKRNIVQLKIQPKKKRVILQFGKSKSAVIIKYKITKKGKLKKM